MIAVLTADRSASSPKNLSAKASVLSAIALNDVGIPDARPSTKKRYIKHNEGESWFILTNIRLPPRVRWRPKLSNWSHDIRVHGCNRHKLASPSPFDDGDLYDIICQGGPTPLPGLHRGGTWFPEGLAGASGRLKVTEPGIASGDWDRRSSSALSISILGQRESALKSRARSDAMDRGFLGSWRPIGMDATPTGSC